MKTKSCFMNPNSDEKMEGDVRTTNGGLTKKDLLLGVAFVLLGVIGALVGNYMWYCVENYCYIHPIGLFACFVFIVLIVWIFRQAEKVE
jgi:uncharacterized membrane protein YeaQ/YmgE (transglycosylase-associated protein family)